MRAPGQVFHAATSGVVPISRVGARGYAWGVEDTPLWRFACVKSLFRQGPGRRLGDATMKSILGSKTALGMIAAVLVAVPGVALAADAMNGIIIANDGQSIVVRAGGADTTVPLTSATKIRGTAGALGARTESHPASDLIRGLAVEVKTGDDGSATEITFKKSDLKTAQQIDAGLAGTDARVAQNTQRIDDVGQLVPAGRTKVFFAVGSAVINAEGKQELQAIAAKAKQLKTAYRLVVVGRADTTGNAAANQRLSERRAAAVTAVPAGKRRHIAEQLPSRPRASAHRRSPTTRRRRRRTPTRAG